MINKIGPREFLRVLIYEAPRSVQLLNVSLNPRFSLHGLLPAWSSDIDWTEAVHGAESSFILWQRIRVFIEGWEKLFGFLDSSYLLNWSIIAAGQWAPGRLHPILDNLHALKHLNRAGSLSRRH